jgi:hypothetical protein
MALPVPPTSRHVISLLLLFAVAACSDLPSESANTPHNAIIAVVAGDGQVGKAGHVLPAGLRVRVVDRYGRALSAVHVDWLAEEPDAVYPATSVTNDHGEAHTYWTPRAAGAVRVARARVGATEVVFHAAVGEASPAGLGELTLLEVETFEGSGQVVHPDVADASWVTEGPSRFLALTPYPFGDAAHENPSIYINVGADHEWRVPDGVTNPIAKPDAGHLSDTDLVADPLERQFRLYYRRAGDGNTLLVTTSADGTAWSQPRALFRTRNHEMVSPAIVRRAADRWEMWSVNSGGSGCSAYSTQVERRTSLDGFTWSDPLPVHLGPSTQNVWHLDVQYVEALAKYVAVYSVKSSTDCSTPAMYISTSPDGVTWTHRDVPLLTRGVIPAFRHIVYRSTFLYDEQQNVFTFWHSGASYADNRWTWRVATERRSLGDVLFGTGLIARHPVTQPSAAPPLRIPP